MTGQVVQIVSEMTGYPADLLDLDLDLEADLGIDTVKQAEMFAAVREQFAIPREENLRLRDFPTLNHVIGFARDRAPAPAPAPGRTGRGAGARHGNGRAGRGPRRAGLHRRRRGCAAAAAPDSGAGTPSADRLVPAHPGHPGIS